MLSRHGMDAITTTIQGRKVRMNMQIVIDIPECFYEYCKAQEDATEIQLAVKNGVPLPKGHGNLIDADAVMREMSVVSSRSVKSQMYIIKLAPIIIEADNAEE